MQAIDFIEIMRDSSMKRYFWILCATIILMCGCGSVNESVSLNDNLPIEVVEDRSIPVEVEEESQLQDTEEEKEVELKEEVPVEEIVEELPTYEMVDFTGMSLDNAYSILVENKIEKITLLDEAGDIINENVDYYDVIAQSIEVGADIYLEMPVELVGKLKQLKIYEEVVVSSEVKKRYDLIYEIDGEEVDSFESTNAYKNSLELGMGVHTIRFVEADNEEVYAEAELEIKNDSIVDIEVCEKKDEIEIVKIEISDDYAERVVSVPNLVGVRTDFIGEFLLDELFDNYSVMSDKETIEPSKDWTIIEQSIQADELCLRENELILQCMPTNDFYMEKYGNLTIDEFETAMSEDGYAYDYWKKNFYGSYKEELGKKTSEEKELWRIFSIVDETTHDEKKLSVEVIYAGEVEMPNLVNEKLDVAKKTLIGLGMDNFEINNSTDYTNANMLIVTSQSITAKKKVSADSKVVLKVKKRVVPKPTPTPTPKPTPTDPPKPSYTFTNMNTTKYAKSSVNVRDLPDKTGNKVGSLSGNQMVTVTGKCNETGWYRINYNSGEAYVADSFLVDEKIVVAPPVVDSSKSNNSNAASNSTGNSEGITKSDPVPVAPAPAGTTYVVNTRSEKFHYPNCKSVKKMSDNNRWDCSLSRDELISKGYSPCGNCHP